MLQTKYLSKYRALRDPRQSMRLWRKATKLLCLFATNNDFEL